MEKQCAQFIEDNSTIGEDNPRDYDTLVSLCEVKNGSQYLEPTQNRITR